MTTETRFRDISRPPEQPVARIVRRPRRDEPYRPASDAHHNGFRPSRSDARPANGTNTIIASIPMIGTISDWSALSPISFSRYVGM